MSEKEKLLLLKLQIEEVFPFSSMGLILIKNCS